MALIGYIGEAVVEFWLRSKFSESDGYTHYHQLMPKEVPQKGDRHPQATSFGVYYPDLSATGLNNRKTLILHLRYDLSVYYKNLPRKALFYSPYSKKQFVV